LRSHRRRCRCRRSRPSISLIGPCGAATRGVPSALKKGLEHKKDRAGCGCGRLLLSRERSCVTALVAATLSHPQRLATRCRWSPRSAVGAAASEMGDAAALRCACAPAPFARVRRLRCARQACVRERERRQQRSARGLRCVCLMIGAPCRRLAREQPSQRSQRRDKRAELGRAVMRPRQPPLASQTARMPQGVSGALLRRRGVRAAAAPRARPAACAPASGASVPREMHPASVGGR
jgi:hypothetical protein